MSSPNPRAPAFNHAASMDHAQVTTKSTSISTQNQASFHLFPTLPAELRIKIWNMVDQEPRYIDAETQRALLQPFTLPKGPFNGQFNVNMGSSELHDQIREKRLFPVPSLLQVCSESRHESLQYNKCMRLSCIPSIEERDLGFIDPNLDTLTFESFQALETYDLLAGAEKKFGSVGEIDTHKFTEHTMFQATNHVLVRFNCFDPLPMIQLYRIKLDIVLAFQSLESLTIVMQSYNPCVIPNLKRGFESRWNELWEGKSNKPKLILKEDEAMMRCHCIRGVEILEELNRVERGTRAVGESHSVVPLYGYCST